MAKLTKEEKNRIEAFNPTETVEFELVKTFAMQRAWYIKLWEKMGYDLEGAQWNALNRLWLEDGLQQVQIARLIGVDKPHVTRMIDEMQAKKWVERKPDPNDRRAHRIFLTKKGRELRYELVPLFLQARAAAMKGITQKDEAELRRILLKMQQNLH